MYQLTEKGRELLRRVGLRVKAWQACVVKVASCFATINKLLKLDSYPFEEYGVLEGEVTKLSKVPYRDSVFLSLVQLDSIAPQRNILLTTGMQGTAEIITEDASLLQRLLRNINKVLGSYN